MLKGGTFQNCIIFSLILISTLTVPGGAESPEPSKILQTSSLYLLPEYGTFYVGQEFDIHVYVETDQYSLTQISSMITFDSSILQYKGISFAPIWNSGSSQGTASGNTIGLGAMLLTPGTYENGLVATIRVKALKSGETALVFDPQNTLAVTETMQQILFDQLGGAVYWIRAEGTPTQTQTPTPTQTSPPPQTYHLKEYFPLQNGFNRNYHYEHSSGQSGTSTITINGPLDVSGNQAYEMKSQMGSLWERVYYNWSGGFLRRYKWTQSDGDWEIFTDPSEEAPEYLDKNAIDQTLGNGGQYYGDDYTGYDSRRITCYGLTNVTVPAGTFQVLYIKVYGEYHDSDGDWGYGDAHFYLLKGFGFVLMEEYDHSYDADDNKWEYEETSYQLMSSTPPPTPTHTPTATPPPTPYNDAGYTSLQAPSSMYVGKEENVRVSMKNTGTKTWSQAGNYKLGSQCSPLDYIWGITRVELYPGENLPPGYTRNFDFKITAPSTPGTYDFRWQMIQEGVDWFGDKSPQGVSITVLATPTPTATPTPSPSPTPGDNNIGQCFRESGGSLNGQTVDAGHDRINVKTGEAISGTISIRTENLLAPSGVYPLGYTVNWGDRATQPVEVYHDIRTGTNVYSLDIDKTAPSTPGTYYIIVAWSGEYNIHQVMSRTNWDAFDDQHCVWYDSNDVGFDWGIDEFDKAMNEGAVQTLMLGRGGYVPYWLACTAIRVIVEERVQNDARFVDQDVLLEIPTGQSCEVSVSMKNTGTTSWTGSGGYKLASQNPSDNWIWGRNRVALDSGEEVKPGDTREFTFTIDAPNTPGTYDFQWRMIQEGVEAFGEYGDNLEIKVTTPKQTERVWAWGRNDYCQLGDGTTYDSHEMAPVRNLQEPGFLAAGGFHSLFLTGDGDVWAWGRNEYGQLGDGTNSWRFYPAPVSSLTDVQSIACGWGHSLAVLKDGTVRAWGTNLQGELGDGTTVRKYTPVKVKDLSSVNRVAGGRDFSLAIKNDHTVWAWGANRAGELGNGTGEDSLVPVQVPGISAKQISAGWMHSLALTDTDKVMAWGDNGYGQLGDGTLTDEWSPIEVKGLSGVIQVAAGRCHSLALKADGTVYAWGNNDFGQLGDGTNTEKTTPVPVKDLTDVSDISCGGDHCLARKRDGAIWAWGRNDSGQLGDGTFDHRNTPVPILADTLPEQIAAGGFHSLACMGKINVADASLWVFPENCRFGLYTRKTLQIANQGKGVLSWRIKCGDPWLSVSRSFGTGNDTVSCYVDPSLLSEGLHSSTLTIESNGGDREIPVSARKGQSDFTKQIPLSGMVWEGDQASFDFYNPYICSSANIDISCELSPADHGRSYLPYNILVNGLGMGGSYHYSSTGGGYLNLNAGGLKPGWNTVMISFPDDRDAYWESTVVTDATIEVSSEVLPDGSLMEEGYDPFMMREGDTFCFDLNSPYTCAGLSVSVRSTFRGLYLDGDTRSHLRFIVKVNGMEAGGSRKYYSGHGGSINVPPGLLQKGKNTIELVIPDDGDPYLEDTVILGTSCVNIFESQLPEGSFRERGQGPVVRREGDSLSFTVHSPHECTSAFVSIQSTYRGIANSRSFLPIIARVNGFELGGYRKHSAGVSMEIPSGVIQRGDNILEILFRDNQNSRLEDTLVLENSFIILEQSTLGKGSFKSRGQGPRVVKEGDVLSFEVTTGSDNPSATVGVHTSTRGLAYSPSYLPFIVKVNGTDTFYSWSYRSIGGGYSNIPPGSLVKGKNTIAIEFTDNGDSFVQSSLLLEDSLIQVKGEDVVYIALFDAEKPGYERIGAVADGASRLLIRISGLSDEITQDDIAVQGIPSYEGELIGEPVMDAEEKGVAWQEYLAPADFPGWDEPTYHFYVKFKVKEETFQKEIVLVRPPVVMLHGLWGKGSKWEAFEKSLAKKGFKFTCSHDYNWRADLHFQNTRNVAKIAIRNAKAMASNDGYVAKKVDLVTHSMGGILGRHYIQDLGAEGYEYQDDIRRFVTIGTPHSGSELANVGVFIRDYTKYGSTIAYAMDKIGCNIENGAMDDLCVNSDAMDLVLNARNLGRHPVPSHAVVGAAPLSSPPDSLWGKILWNEIIFRWPILKVTTLLGSPNDYVVRGTSQQGGLEPPYMNEIAVSWHVPENTDPDVIRYVIDLLRDKTDDRFDPRGFVSPVDLDFKLDLGTLSYIKQHPVRVTDDAAISITSPAGGTVFNPGDDLAVTVDVLSGQVDAVLVSTGFDGSILEIAPFEENFRIPDDFIGEILVTAMGRNDQGVTGEDSLSVNVATPETVTRIRTSPGGILFLGKGEQAGIRTFGYYTDLVERDISSPVTGTVYSSSDPSIAAVTPDGIVDGISEGGAVITITNNVSLDLQITVLPPLEPPPPVCALLDLTSYGDVWGAASMGIPPFSPPERWGWPGFRFDPSNHHYPITSDADGDGLRDLVQFTPYGDVWVALNSGTKIENPTRWGWLGFFYDESNGSRDWYPLSGDFNGDGNDDLLQFTQYGDVWAALSDGEKYQNPTRWGWLGFFFSRGSGSSEGELPLSGDFNGDGKDDLVQLTRYGELWVALSSGSGFLPPARWGRPGFRFAPLLGYFPLCADVTGDGMDDLIQITPNKDAWVAGSTGSAFSVPGNWGALDFHYSEVAGEIPLAGDVNADGKADLIQIRNGEALVALSGGGSFQTPESWGHLGFKFSRSEHDVPFFLGP